MSKYYYHVIYESGFVDYYGSNVSSEFYWHYTPNKLLNEERTQVLTFELNDLLLTTKFIKAYKNKVWHATYDYKIRGNKGAFEMISDVYRGLTKDWILESRTEMNDIINFFNAHPVSIELGYSFPEELKLNDTDLNDMRIPSLNRLHELFETYMSHLADNIDTPIVIGDHQTTVAGDHVGVPSAMHDLLWHKLQSVNLLVHYNEKLDQNIEILFKFTNWIKEKMKNSKDDASAACNDYLKVLGLVATAHAWVKVLEVSFKDYENNKKFYEEKIQTANFFFNRVLPRIESYYLTATSGSKYIMDFKFN